MDKSVRIQQGMLGHRLAAFLLDLSTIVVSTLVLYLIILYAVFATCFNYVGNQNRIKEIEEHYVLNLASGLDYKEYEIVLQNFYFNEYKDEIVSNFKEIYDKEYTITHIYNCVVLRLNMEPTYENYKTEYFKYIQKDDGSFDVDSLALKIDGSGDVYKKNMHDIFYNAYVDLKTLLKEYNEEYEILILDNFSYETWSRTIAFIISACLIYVFVPLKNKEGASLFEKIFKLGNVDSKTGYLLTKKKIILRPVVYYLIPLFAIMVGSNYSIIIFGIGYIFINLLMLLFSNDNADLANKLIKIESVSIEESLLFENSEDEKAFMESPEGQQIDDIDYLNRLSEIKKVNLNVSRNEELKK